MIWNQVKFMWRWSQITRMKKLLLMKFLWKMAQSWKLKIQHFKIKISIFSPIVICRPFNDDDILIYILKYSREIKLDLPFCIFVECLCNFFTSYRKLRFFCQLHLHYFYIIGLAQAHVFRLLAFLHYFVVCMSLNRSIFLIFSSFCHNLSALERKWQRLSRLPELNWPHSIRICFSSRFAFKL